MVPPRKKESKDNMTATNIVCQPHNRCVLAVCDGAQYTSEGLLLGIGTKVATAPHWPGFITSRGGMIPAAILGRHLTSHFATFDLLVAGIEEKYPEFVKSYGFDTIPSSLVPELIIAGWSAARDRPESYVICINDDLPPGHDISDSRAILPQEYRLLPLPACTAGPAIVGTDLARAAGFDGVRVKQSIETSIADLTKLIELQRRFKPDGIDHYFVGGFAELTIVRSDSIEQRILRRWPDVIGERIDPFRFRA
jgi:hypothetical protein